MNISWNPNIEDINKKEIEKYLKPYLWLVPKWCQKLRVSLYPASEDGGNAIECTTVYEYRTIKLDFYASWLNETKEAKEMHIIHDLLHGFTSIIVDYAGETFDTLCPSDEAEKFNKALHKELSMRCESSTQDLAFAIYNKFNGR